MTQQLIDYAMQRLDEMHIAATQFEGEIWVTVWTKDLSDSFDMALSEGEIMRLAEDVMYHTRRRIHPMFNNE
jgi:hypothetical protein